MQTILTTTSSFGDHLPGFEEILLKKGYAVVKNPFGRKLTPQELVDLLEKNRPIGLLAGTETISEEAMEAAKGYLKIISRVGVGWDNVDHKTAEKLGISVFRTKGVLNEAVGELTLGMILSSLRHVSNHDRRIRSGAWKKTMGSLLKGKVIGIIGFGAIGQYVGKLATAFGTTVIYHDPVLPDAPWARSVSFTQLLEQADIISIHADVHQRLLGEEEFALCKEGVVLVNTGRGGVVDENALYNALVSGQVAYACLDVFEKEPYSGPLMNLDNVLLTPHIGSYAREARIRMEEMAIENLMNALS